MAVRNQHWYNANETRSYPIDETASQISDQGERLPSNILSDINLRYPKILGEFPFLSSVGVTDNLVSITIQASVIIEGTGALAPVAVFSILKSELVEGRPYALDAQYPGAGGWVVFGSGVQENFTGRFSGPQQSLIAPRAARAYRPLPVESIAKLSHVEELTGVVRLLGSSPVEVVKEAREIEGEVRDAIVVRLIADATLQSGGQEVNVFEALAGPCNKRPESDTCDDPEPIEFINTVPPDCDGNITIELRGCAEIARVLNACGVVVDCSMGLIDACLDNRLPDDDGRLPNEYDDLCEPSEVSEGLPPDSPGPPEPPVSPGPDISESAVSIPDAIPFFECFPFTPEIKDLGWSVLDGSFIPRSDPLQTVHPFCNISSPHINGTDESERIDVPNMQIWEGSIEPTTGQRVTAYVKMLSVPVAIKHNAGLVLNFRERENVPTQNEYFLVEIDYDTQEFRIMRFNGSVLAPTSASVVLPGLILQDEFYSIVAEIVDVGGDNVDITAFLDSQTGPALSVTLGPLTTSRFLPDTGSHGVRADRAASRFSFFSIEDL
jgi:hypothetical protein